MFFENASIMTDILLSTSMHCTSIEGLTLDLKKTTKLKSVAVMVTTPSFFLGFYLE